MTNQNSKIIYFNNLDAFRFFSFLSVFFSHTLILPATSNKLFAFFESLITFSYLGVPSFFTLSSFLITYLLLIEKEKQGIIHLLKFYKNRILRIWPAYYLLIIICFLLLPGVSSIFNLPAPSLPAIFPFLFFYANFYIIENGMGFTFALSILWSISIEEQFYLVWGLVLKMLSKKKRMSLFILLLFVVSVGFSYYYLYVQNKPEYNLAIHSIYVLQNFCTGAYLAIICIRKEKLFKLLGRISTIGLSSVYLVLPLACFIVKDIILLNVIKSICYSLIIYDQCFNEKRLFNGGRFPFINYLGKISYGLYLFHALVIVTLEKSFHFFSHFIQRELWVNLFQVLVTFIITVIVAHISYKFMESKFLALKSVSTNRINYKI